MPPDSAVAHRVAITPYSGVALLVTAALVVLGGYTGSPVMTGALVLVGLVLAWGWPLLLDLPRPPGTSVVLAVEVGMLAVIDLWPDLGDALSWLSLALAIGLLLTFLHELLRTDGRANLVVSISGCALGLVLLADGAFFRQVLVHREGGHALLAAAAAVVLAAVAQWAIGRRPRAAEWVLPVSLVLGGAGGLVVAGATSGHWNVLLVTGVVAAGVSHSARRVLAPLIGHPAAAAELALGCAQVLVVGLIPLAAIWVFSA